MKYIFDFINAPKTTTEQRAKLAILCALEASKDQAFIEWANNWLSGQDGSEKMAWKIRMHVRLLGLRAEEYAALTALCVSESLDCDKSYAWWSYKAALRVVEDNVEEAARKWCPENWAEINRVWLRERKANFRKLVSKARAKAKNVS